MELRCAWRSINISETSRFGYSIRYILRLMAASSTENTQCGVLPPAPIIYLSIGSNHVALPTKTPAHLHVLRIMLRSSFYNDPGNGSGCRSDGRLDGRGPGGQHPRRRVQWQHVGRGCLGENTWR